jgi:hypothetical protein
MLLVSGRTTNSGGCHGYTGFVSKIVQPCYHCNQLVTDSCLRLHAPSHKAYNLGRHNPSKAIDL